MSATKESSLKIGDERPLGIIAGGGEIPLKLIQECEKNKQSVFIIGLEGHTNPDILIGRPSMMTRIGAAGTIIQTLKDHNVRDLVLIGSVKRPSLVELRPDLRSAKFFAKIGMRALGDDGLLKALREELENEGFQVQGIQNYIHDLLTRPGVLGKHKPKADDETTIQKGVSVAREIGMLDIGQSAVVQEGIVLGVEGVEGTDSLIKRCAMLKKKGRGPILVKTAKPQQDQDLDLPTIGPKTVRLCSEYGYAGIVIQANSSLIFNLEEVINIANDKKLFIIGYEIDSAKTDA